MAWYPGKYLDELRRRFFGQRAVLAPPVAEEEEIKGVPEQLEDIAKEFREGIAEALGVPPEAIKEEIVAKWVKNWAKAFVKPEYRWTVGIAGQADLARTARELGYELGRIVRRIARGVRM